MTKPTPPRITPLEAAKRGIQNAKERAEALDLLRAREAANPAPRLDEIATAIQGIKRRAFLDVGKLLLEAKALLPHGEFLPWVSAHTGISASSAENAMNAAAAVAKFPNFGNLPRTTLYKITAPNGPKDLFDEVAEAETVDLPDVKAKLREHAQKKAAKDEGRAGKLADKHQQNDRDHADQRQRAEERGRKATALAKMVFSRCPELANKLYIPGSPAPGGDLSPEEFIAALLRVIKESMQGRGQEQRPTTPLLH